MPDEIELERQAAFARDLRHHLHHALQDWMAANLGKGVKPAEVVAGLALFAGTGLAWIAMAADLPDPATAHWPGDYETLARQTLTETLAEARRRGER